MGELSAEREAARAAIEQLRLAAVMFDAGARPHPPESLYRAYLDQADVFVGIYWQAVLREADDPIGLGYVLSHFGLFLRLDGDVARARSLHEEIIPISRGLEDGNQLAEAHCDLALDALADGDLEPVPAHLTAAVGRYRHIDHREGLCRCLAALGALAVADGDPRLAARLMGATFAARDAIGLGAENCGSPDVSVGARRA